MSKMLVVNPSKAKGRKRRVSRVGRRVKRRAKRKFTFPLIAAATRRKGRRRNPSPAVSRRGAAPSTIAGQVKNATIGAAGGLALDMAMGVVGKRVPSNLTVGPARHLLKAGVALVLGVVGTKVLKSGLIGTAVQGALTITLHDAAKEMLMRGTGVGEYLDASVNDMGEYIEGIDYNNGQMQMADVEAYDYMDA